MVELVLAHLSDQGASFSDYPEALQHFFTYVAKSNLKKRIVFEDYYRASTVSTSTDRVQIIDPVNANNNTSRLYNDSHASAVVNAALDAGDAIDAALYATTKGQTVDYWQKVFGPTFQV